MFKIFLATLVLIVSMFAEATLSKIKNIRGLENYAGRRCENTGDEVFCNLCNTYFEAGVEPYVGKLEVARTVLQRKQVGYWGKSSCSVVWAPEQFSWTFLDGDTHLPAGGQDLEDSYRATLQAIQEGGNGATHYFNPEIVEPSWARHCHWAPIYKQVTQAEVGHQVFLTCPVSRTIGAEESARRPSRPRSRPPIHSPARRGTSPTVRPAAENQNPFPFNLPFFNN